MEPNHLATLCQFDICNGNLVEFDVNVKDEPEMKTENPVESDVLHTDISVKDEPEMKTGNPDKSYVLNTYASLTDRPETNTANPVESSVLHSDKSVKYEPETDTENLAGDHPFVRKEIKNETDKVVLHLQSCDVKVKCEGGIKTEMSFSHSSQVTQSEVRKYFSSSFYALLS